MMQRMVWIGLILTMIGSWGCGDWLDQDPLTPQERKAEDASDVTKSDGDGAESSANLDDTAPKSDSEVVTAAEVDLGDATLVDEAQDADSPLDEGDAQDPESTPYPAQLMLQAAHQAEEIDFLQRLNAERTTRGLNELEPFWELEVSARDHSEVMANLDDLHHNPELSSVTQSGYWTRLGENVGRGHSVPSLHDAFMASPDHKANIVGDFTHVGIGVVIDDGQIWVTVVFMKAAVSGLHTTHPPFVDTNFNTHDANIKKIYDAGITHGCAGGERPRYCPDGSVTRGQMAAFLDRAFELPEASESYFTDTAGSFYESHANNLRAAEITYGCSDDEYCGEQAVTRGQMAAFLDRALDLPPASQNYFSDTSGRYYEDHANNLREAGITHGCGGDQYCGEDTVTRDQMASFLARALDL